MLQSAASHNTVAGNYIGTDVTGTAALGNTVLGVNILNGASNNTVGGTAPGAGNLISGNRGLGGVLIQGAGTSGNVVAGNFIGTDVSGTAPLGNVGAGVTLGAIGFSASGNTVGGTAPGAGNTIAYNRKGVVVAGTGSTGNAILGNSIFANLGAGIDLGDDGVTLNDSAGHSGPNNYQNFPVLTQATTASGSRTVFGQLSSTPNTTFRIEFFANDAYDPSGYGEGQVYLGFVNVTTAASGTASFRFTYTSDPAHSYLTSTATGPSGTSEFSGRDLPPVNSVPGPRTTAENVPLAFSGATALSISDPDNNGTDPLQITLTVSHGTLTLASLAGLSGSGNGTPSLTYTGSLAALNAALAELTYTPALFYDGPDILTLATSDLVAPELGGPGTATSRVAITVVDVVNPPKLTVRAAAGNEGQAIPLLIQASTVDTDGSETLSVQISGVPASATLSAGTNDGNGIWTLTADELTALTLIATDNVTFVLTVTATTTLRATGATAATTRTLLVTVANVAPTALLGDDGPIDEGDHVTVSFTNPSDPSLADTTAGFRYSFALSPADLATGSTTASAAASQRFAFDDSGTYTVYGRVVDKDGGFTDYTIFLAVRNIAPTAVFGDDGAIDEGGSVTVLFTNPADPSSADTAAGFRYSFALTPADLVTSYPAAGAVASQHFTFDRTGTYTVYGRIFDKDGGFTDFSMTVTVPDLPPGPPPDLPPHSPIAPTPPEAPTPPAAPTLPTDALPPAVPPALPPAVPIPPLQPTIPGVIPLVPPLPSRPGQPPLPVGGDTQASDSSVPPRTESQVEFGSGFAGSNSFEPSIVSPVTAAQAFMLMPPAGREELHRAPPGPEVQTILQGNQVLAPHLDGDDSVRVVERLLPENDEPAGSRIRLASGRDVPEPEIPALPPPAPVERDAEPADASPPLTRLVQWLAVPAGVALVALGCLWFRARRGRTVTAQSGGPVLPQG